MKRSSKKDTYRDQVLFVVESGPRIGTACLLRMVTLAKSIQVANGEAKFYTSHLPNRLRRSLIESGIHFLNVNGPVVAASPSTSHLRSQQDAAAEITGFIQRTPATIVLAESHTQYASIQSAVGHQVPLVTLDRGGYVQWPDQTSLLDGQQSGDLAFDHVVLKHPTNPLIPCRAKPERNASIAPRILVALHAFADGKQTSTVNVQLHIAQAVKEYLDQVAESIPPSSDNSARRSPVVDFVVGCNESALAIQQFVREQKIRGYVHRNIDRIDFLAPRSALAIAPLNAVYCELLRFGVPTIAISSSAHYQPPDLTISNASLPVIPISTEGFISQLAVEIQQLLENPRQRQSISQAGKRHFANVNADAIANRLITPVPNRRAA